MEVSDNVVIHSIVAYVVDSKTYAWMQANDCAGVDDSVRYSDFLIWNTKCVSKASDEERAWILALCLRFRTNTIHVTDLKNCRVAQRTLAIYYDTSGRLCIVNP